MFYGESTRSTIGFKAAILLRRYEGIGKNNDNLPYFSIAQQSNKCYTVVKMIHEIHYAIIKYKNVQKRKGNVK